MEQAINELLTENVLNRARVLFQLDESINKLGDFENFVYEVFKHGMPMILRITHESHRKGEEIASELDWINFLSRKGIAVSRAYESINGRLVESIEGEDESMFFVSLFSKAEGKPIRLMDPDFNEKLFQAWGKAIGQIHQATMEYEVPTSMKRRPRWDEDDLLVNMETYIPADETDVIKNAKELLEELKQLPTDKDSFNLIHGDIHSGNFFYDGEKIHLFDFDDASYHWLTSDIAIPVYYSTWYRHLEDDQEVRDRFAKHFLQAFIKGYESVTKLPPQWKEHLPLMLRLRDGTLYSVLHKKIAPEDRNERIVRMMEELRGRIQHKKVLVNV